MSEETPQVPTDFTYAAPPQPEVSAEGYAPQPHYEYSQTPPPANAGYNIPYRGIGSPQKEKWVAAVLAFTLGSFGVHKFYLGYKNEGIIMLIVSIVGMCCTLGLGTCVISVIALIEAVRYIILSQEDFEATYVNGRKGWL